MNFIKYFFQKIKSKKIQIYILLFSILIFFILSFVYNKLMLNSKCIFVLKSDISKGERLSYDNIQKVIIKNFNQEELIEPYDCVAKFDLKKGQILNSEIISKDEISTINEKVIIPLSDTFDTIKKGDFVNIYITTNKENIKDIKNTEYVSLTNKTSDNITIKIINNVEILGMYKNNEDKKCIIVEAEKDIVLLIENIKDISKFSLSIVERRG